MTDRVRPSPSRTRLALLMLVPAVIVVAVFVVVTTALITNLQSDGDARFGVARVGSDLALVIVTSDDGAPVTQVRRLINVGVGAAAIALIPGAALAWVVSTRVRREVDDAHAEIDDADVERQRRLQEVIHELRTPLAVMATNLELAGGDGEYLDAARRAVARMSRTVNDLSGHGGLAVEQEAGPVDLAVLAEAVASEHAGPGRVRGLHLVVRDSPSVVVVASDPNAAHSVVGNFLSNAVRLAPRGSAITLDWGRYEGWGWVSVSDEGPGLAPQHHARVFERGWRGSHERNMAEDYSGAGLGLTIARQVTEAQGGVVSIDSAEGAGTTFTMWLPLHHGADRSAVLAADHIHPSVRPWLRPTVDA